MLVALGGLLASGTASLFTGRPRRLWRRLDGPSRSRIHLSPAPVQTLSPDSAALLSAAAAAMVGVRVDRVHYEEFYSWRSEHLPGYHALYEDIAETLRRPGQSPQAFIDLAPDAGMRVLEAAFSPRAFDRFTWTTAWLDQRAARIRMYFVDETLELFNATDAWVALGYAGWPGMPRGLEAYRRPLPPDEPAPVKSP